MKKRPALMVATAIAFSGVALAATLSKGTPPVVDAAGKLRVPPNYHASYQYLGSWSVAADANEGAKEMHIVYASPAAVGQYKRTGHFADGTVLVKEVFAAQTLSMTTGTVSHPNPEPVLAGVAHELQDRLHAGALPRRAVYGRSAALRHTDAAWPTTGFESHRSCPEGNPDCSSEPPPQ